MMNSHQRRKDLRASNRRLGATIKEILSVDPEARRVLDLDRIIYGERDPEFKVIGIIGYEELTGRKL